MRDTEQPADSVAGIEPPEVSRSRVSFWCATLGLGSLLGGFCGLLITGQVITINHAAWILWGGLAIAWFAALSAIVCMMPSGYSIRTKSLLSVLLTVAAYILFVPTCTATAMVSSGFLGTEGYGPSKTAVVFASIVAFTGILSLFAVGLRFQFARFVTK